jgi:hypothetical protein
VAPALPSHGRAVAGPGVHGRDAATSSPCSPRRTGGAGQPAAGLDLLAEALDRVEANGGRWLEAELYRFRGELLLALPDRNPSEAEACFRRAVAVAREQDTRT